MTASTSSALPQTRVGTRRRPDSAGPVVYDFRRPTTLSREHSRALQIALETFCRQATTVLTSTLREVCQVTITSVEQRTYAEYVESLAAQTYMSLLSIEPVPGVGLLEMPLPAAMRCVDHLLGGPGGTEQPDRPLTEIESNLVNDLVERLLGELRYAFEPLVLCEPTVTGVEYNPQFAQAASASEPTVVTSFDMRIGEHEHVATLCLPLAGLLPHLTAAGNTGMISQRDRDAQRLAAATMAMNFHTVPVEVSVRLRSTRVDPSVLIDLTPGDVVRLQHPTQAPFDITAEDVVFAHATAGTRGRRAACLVVSPPTTPQPTSGHFRENS